MTKKDNGEPKPSRIIIEFRGIGIVDQIKIMTEPDTVTGGQFFAATMQMLGMCLFNIFDVQTADKVRKMQAQQEKMQTQAMTDSLIRTMKDE